MDAVDEEFAIVRCAMFIYSNQYRYKRNMQSVRSQRHHIVCCFLPRYGGIYNVHFTRGFDTYANSKNITVDWKHLVGEFYIPSDQLTALLLSPSHPHGAIPLKPYTTKKM